MSMPGHARNAMGVYTAALSTSFILACISLGFYVQANKSKDPKKNQNVVLGTLAASVGVGALTLISAFSYIGKQGTIRGQEHRMGLQQQLRQLRHQRGGSRMGQDFGQFE